MNSSDAQTRVLWGMIISICVPFTQLVMDYGPSSDVWFEQCYQGLHKVT